MARFEKSGHQMANLAALMLEEDSDNPLASLETRLKASSPSRVHLCLFETKGTDCHR